MKRCTTCLKEKPVVEFYARIGRCKECHKAAVRANRKKNIDYYRAYDMERFRTDPKRKAHVQRVVARRRKLVAGYVRAHSAVSYAVRRGRLTPQPCEVCGHPCAHAHHDDYSKPLDVRWLCPPHHSEAHRKMKEPK